ncbi:MAG TPA: [LysW]-lysine hydrolase [Anaerolineaceae bacterium]|nr:[LysW]-lysine hydrolase [Anaerolineaceae bacterium]
MSLDEVALLEGLLKQYSPTGQETSASDYLVGKMHALGFTAKVDPAGNAIGTLGNGANEILLLGHIDTVPGFIDVTRQQDNLYGRGSVDAKGPLACFVCAAVRAKILPDWRITVIGAVAEEGDSHGAKYICEHYNPQMVVIGEPSGWDRITLGYKGSIWFRYSVVQALAHTAGRSGSACEAAVNYWNTLRRLADEYNAQFQKVFDQLSPTLREMNSTQQGFYETAHLKIGMRLPMGISVPQAIELVSGAAGDADVKIVDSIPAFRAEKNTPLVRAFLASIRQLGGQPGFSLKTGTSDMNLAGPTWPKAPILAYGPGDSNLDHTPEEHIQVSEYLAGIQVLAAALEYAMQADIKTG